MPHYVLNFAEAFKTRVIGDFIATYQKGWTPNPCILCNRAIKFEMLLTRARALGFDTLVTGHYARVETDAATGRRLLRKGLDAGKDQSYVLYCLTQDQLAHTFLPLGGLSKVQVRELAAEVGLENARKAESQDICFVPDGDYGRFIEDYTGRPLERGSIIDPEGRVLGRHRGQERYTIGQRRGLGLSFPQPMYVSAKSAAAHTVTLSPESGLYARSLLAERINLIPASTLDGALSLRVRARYLQPEQRATVRQTGADQLRIDFDEPQRALTPGQAAVLYDGDLVVGGGTIVQVL
jgi:tRNA-specific 2-thiouridylase